ncbi:hypothetical protein Hanom_Chr11g01051861 [Helianthus anomalus]
MFHLHLSFTHLDPVHQPSQSPTIIYRHLPPHHHATTTATCLETTFSSEYFTFQNKPYNQTLTCMIKTPKFQNPQISNSCF